MEKEFVSYEQAVALKELGCGVIMNYKYWRVEKKILVFYSDYNMQSIIDKGFDVECLNVYAPLKQQIFRWFREKHDAHMHPSRLMRNIYVVRYGDWDSEAFKTYEEAENACIDKLIELAKQQDNG